MALAELSLVNVLRVVPALDRRRGGGQTGAMGGDPWPYGFARNRDEIAAMIRYAVEDGLADQPLPPEALFAPETLSLLP